MAKKYSLDKITRYFIMGVFLFAQVTCASTQTAFAQAQASSPEADPMSEPPLAPLEEIISQEDTISLDLRGIDIIQLFKLLSAKLKKNILPSKKVSGKVTLFLDKVSYDDVLDIIMETQGLAYEERGENIIIVMTESEYESLYGKKFKEKREIKTIQLKYAQPKMVFNALGKLKSKIGDIIVDESTGTLLLIDTPDKIKIMEDTIKKLDQPVEIEAFELQYANAVDIKDNISSLITPGTGSVVSDERSNVLIVTDLSGNMEKIRQAIVMLDLETRQVYIEAEILELTLSDRLRFGINWQKIMNDPYLWGTVLTGTFPASSVSSSYLRLTMGTIADDQWTATINMLNELGDVKILSSPRLAVINNEEAVILVGTKQPYVTATTSQSGESTITSDNVEFVDIGVKLTVVPTINRDGFIIMKIKPEVSSQSATPLTTGTAADPRSSIPIITTSETETTVKIKDGATLMIAGLKKDTNSKDIDGVPFLAKIPILGLIFGSRNNYQQQEEIIIFLTPHIIKGDNMMDWDKQEMSRFPPAARPEVKDYAEPGFNSENLKKLRRKKR